MPPIETDDGPRCVARMPTDAMDLLHADVVGDRKPRLVGFVLHRLHDVAVDPHDLDAVHALRLERADPGTGVLRGANPPAFDRVAGT